MDSEALGVLVADVLRGLGAAPAAGYVPARRSAPGTDADLVVGALPTLPSLPVGQVATAVAEHPDVEWAEVAGGLLLVRVTEVSRARSLAPGASLPAADLRSPERPILLSEVAGPVTADEAREVLGPDVVAYELARAHRPGAGGPVPVDVEAAVGRTSASPLFTVQAAHVTAARLTSRAVALGVDAMRDNEVSWARRGPAGPLVASLLELPATVARAVRRDEVRLVPRHLEVARLFDALDPEYRFLPSGDEEVTGSHVAGVRLAAATQGLLARAMHLLGVAAPTRI